MHRKGRPAHLSRIVLAALFGAIAFSVEAEAGQLWSIFDPTGSITTTPGAITAHNLVAGTYYDSSAVTHGFLRTPDGTLTAFDAPDALYGTSVTGANTAGEITGYGQTSSGSVGFVREADGTLTTFQYEATSTRAMAINARGTIVGFATSGGSNNHAFLRKRNGKLLPLLTGVNAIPFAINKTGVIAGTSYDGSSHGFVRAASGDVATFDVPGATATQPQSINASGEVAGYAYDSNGVFHGFVREPDGTITTFDAPGSGTQQNRGTIAKGINDHGDIVGCVTGDGDGLDVHGFVREASGVMHVVDMPGASFTCLYAIGPTGKLAGQASYHGLLAQPRVWQAH